MRSIIRHKRVLYYVKWLGYPRKKDWTYEPYENFLETAKGKLLEFHYRNPAAPRYYRLSGPAEAAGANRSTVEPGKGRPGEEEDRCPTGPPVPGPNSRQETSWTGTPAQGPNGRQATSGQERRAEAYLPSRGPAKE